MSALTIIAQLAGIYAAVLMAAVIVGVGVGVVSLAVSAIKARVRSNRIPRAAKASRLAMADRAALFEPDPIESSGEVVTYNSPLFPPAPVLFTNKPFEIANPLTNKRISPEVRQ